MFDEVSADEIAFGMALFVDAGGRTASVARVSGKTNLRDHQEGERLLFALSFGLHEDIGEDKRSALLHTHLARAFFAIWNHYRRDPRRPSICARIMGFCSLMERTRGAIVEPWIERSDEASEYVELPPAVVLALASVPLTELGALSESTFVAKIKHFAQGANAPDASAKTVARPAGTWPSGDTETACLIQERDWTSTILGPSSGWPTGLRTTVELILACSFPMIVLWGPELVQFYNDGYRDIMGTKHPTGLGQPTRQCWPEVWSINEPIFRKVQAGETLTFENQLFPIIRYGFLENAYFTLCYSPVRDEHSTIQGVLVTVFETTARVDAGVRRKSDPLEPDEPEADKGQHRQMHRTSTYNGRVPIA